MINLEVSYFRIEITVLVFGPLVFSDLMGKISLQLYKVVVREVYTTNC